MINKMIKIQLLIDGALKNLNGKINLFQAKFGKWSFISSTLQGSLV